MFRIPNIIAICLAAGGLWMLGLSFTAEPEPVSVRPGEPTIAPIHSSANREAVLGMALLAGGILMYFITSRR